MQELKQSDGSITYQGGNGNAAFVQVSGVVQVQSQGALPGASVPVTSSSGNVANASAVATLAGAAAKTTYITGLWVTGAGATAGAAVLVTVTGVVGGTMTFVYVAATGAMVANQSLFVTFPTPVSGSAVNTAIVVTVPALGAGNTNSAVVATGFQL